MGVGPRHLIDITTKTFKFYLKYGPKTSVFGTLIYKFQQVCVARPPIESCYQGFMMLNHSVKYFYQVNNNA